MAAASAHTLLLADDNSTIQRLVELTFANSGIVVTSVSDGSEAIDSLRRRPPDIALLSTSLPRLDGFEVAAFIRQQPALQGTPVLLMAGAFDTIDEHHVRESGAAGVLIKPLEPEVVIKRVKDLLGMSKPPQQAGTEHEAPGRLVTSQQAPKAPAISAETTPPVTPSIATPPSHDGGAADPLGARGELDAGGSAHEEGERQGDPDEHLDAAFDTLDAQLAGRNASAGRPDGPPPPPQIPAAIDPNRRPPAPQPLSDMRDAGGQGTVAPSTPQNPVFEVDASWFKHGESGLSAVAPQGHSGAESDLSAVAPQGDSGAESDLSAVAPQGDSGAKADLSAVAPKSDSGAKSDLSAVAPKSDSGAKADAPDVADVLTAFGLSGSSSGVWDGDSAGKSDSAPPSEKPRAAAPITPVPPADAFAFLLAEEQGEPPPAMPYPSLELSDSAIERLADQVAMRVAPRVVDSAADRLADAVAGRLTESLGDRLTIPVADRLTVALAERLADPVAERVAERIADRVAEQVANNVSARLMQGLLDDTLRRTVAEVSERLVRDEIARIRGQK